MTTFFCVLKGNDLRVFYTLTAPEHYTVENVIDHIHQACQEVEPEPLIYYVFNESSSSSSSSSLAIEQLQVGGLRYPRNALANQVFDEHNILYVPDEEGEEESPEREPTTFFDPVLADIAATIMIGGGGEELTQFMTLDDMFVMAENMSYVNAFLSASPPLLPPLNLNMLTDVVVGIELEELNKNHPVCVYKDKEEQQQQQQSSCCIICLEAYEQNDICRKLKCTHFFHQQCIDAWLGQHTRCPVCRAECGQGVKSKC